jgi:hypothetical protein
MVCQSHLAGPSRPRPKIVSFPSVQQTLSENVGMCRTLKVLMSISEYFKLRCRGTGWDRD